ncbi:MAG: DUF2007 domain-containing protein [Treponema sp.]|nr:DUF2007 domain-containing protein [Treponema sp.]
MLFPIIAYSAFGLLCVWFIISGVKKINEVKHSQSLEDLYTDEKEHDEAIKNAAEFEKGYFERVRNGEQTQQFLAVGSQIASSMIRSLLFAENIPTYTENEHVNSMYSLNNLAASSAFSIKVYILVADYDRAHEIVCDFINKHEAKQEVESDEKSASSEATAQKIAKKVAAGVVTGCFFIPMPDGSEEKMLGITILPKVDA